MLAARSARSCSLAPRDRESRAFIPTVVPAHTAIIRFCNGKARDTAVRAFSLSRETKTLSTMLYSAWTSMEIIMGWPYRPAAAHRLGAHFVLRDPNVRFLGHSVTLLNFSHILQAKLYSTTRIQIVNGKWRKRSPYYGKGRAHPPGGAGAWPSVLRTLRVVGAFPVPRGAAPPLPRPAPGGGPAFFGRKPEERTPGRKRFFLPGPTFSGWGDPGGFSLFFCLACGPVSYVRNGPPPGWAGWGRWFLRREGFFPPPKPSPWGEGAPVRTLGRMRGRSCNQPFLVEKGVTDSRLDVLLLLPRWATRSPLIRHLR